MRALAARKQRHHLLGNTLRGCRLCGMRLIDSLAQAARSSTLAGHLFGRERTSGRLPICRLSRRSEERYMPLTALALRTDLRATARNW